MTNVKHRKKGKPPSNTLPRHFDSGSFCNELTVLIQQYDSFKAQYLGDEMFTKYANPDEVSNAVKARRAVAKWLQCEATNAQTNTRLLFGSYAEEYGEELIGDVSISRLLRKTRLIIANILGPIPSVALKVREQDVYRLVTEGHDHGSGPVGISKALSFLSESGNPDYSSILRLIAPTNGATTDVRRGPLAALAKLQGTPDISASAIEHLTTFLLGGECRSIDEFNLSMAASLFGDLSTHEASEMFTVPKKSDIDRVACKEPSINVLLQRSVGKTIKKRLRKVGINLTDQSKNQNLARVALRKDLATVDLSSASDSISNQLVIDMLPFEWYSLLDDLRCKEVLIPAALHPTGTDTIHIPEMFSSMGNGFTFELESLIFYAAARAVAWEFGVKGQISVFGDDIICPIQMVEELFAYFSYLGFTPNEKKTHSSGEFRESCGEHFFRGLQVSPFYIRKKITSVHDLILHLNHLVKWGATPVYWSYSGFGRTKRLFTLDGPMALFHKKWSKFIPPVLFGGQDVDDNTALVTGCKPRKRLIPVMKEVSVDDYQQESLVQWMMQNSLRQRVLYHGRSLDHLLDRSCSSYTGADKDNTVEMITKVTRETGRVKYGKNRAWWGTTTYLPYGIGDCQLVEQV